MVMIHNLGFPRIGAQRQLKYALESYWSGHISESALLATAAQLQSQHWALQKGLDWVPVGDFSLYDHVLDTSVMLGNIPARFEQVERHRLDRYFAIARGPNVASNALGRTVAAAEMTKWFDTNYHYIVPEFEAQTTFQLNADALLESIAQAQSEWVKVKPVILGPVTYLALGKVKDRVQPLDLLPRLLPVYEALLAQLAAQGVSWVQIDEPLLVTELSTPWMHAFQMSYERLQQATPQILLTTYFGSLLENKHLVAQLPVAGVHVDAVHGSVSDLQQLVTMLPRHSILSIGVINGRNIWKTNLNAALDWLEPLVEQRGDNVWLAPSCSLMHVPVDLRLETVLDDEIKSWMAFAHQKLDELRVLGDALTNGRSSVSDVLAENAATVLHRQQSSRVHQPGVAAKVAQITPEMAQRQHPYHERAQCQADRLQLPLWPTTTIGSFPQTPEIRAIRHAYKVGTVDACTYEVAMHAEIERCIRAQEALDLDVLVHGEPERSDMVEYFGEQLTGFVLSQSGWVQSYGSRCVKPPILYGDVSRPQAMTVKWLAFAQSLTHRPVKGMLTGPVTLLQWSFVRDDQPREVTCQQLALAIREEVLDLEAAGLRMIQIDEAALREGLPLRRAQWHRYFAWAIAAFRLAAHGVRDDTQIHTHMCYAEFHDLIDVIAQMDADVTTLETSRSGGELLSALQRHAYPNALGPGVYDVHSPQIPHREEIVKQLQQIAQHIPIQRLWVNPDCGLKTRRWEEVIPALTQMVLAAKQLRQQHTPRL